jgi:hypothetical protein
MLIHYRMWLSKGTWWTSFRMAFSAAGFALLLACWDLSLTCFLGFSVLCMWLTVCLFCVVSRLSDTWHSYWSMQECEPLLVEILGHPCLRECCNVSPFLPMILPFMQVFFYHPGEWWCCQNQSKLKSLLAQKTDQSSFTFEMSSTKPQIHALTSRFWAFGFTWNNCI